MESLIIANTRLYQHRNDVGKFFDWKSSSFAQCEVAIWVYFKKFECLVRTQNHDFEIQFKSRNVWAKIYVSLSIEFLLDWIIHNYSVDIILKNKKYTYSHINIETMKENFSIERVLYLHDVKSPYEFIFKKLGCLVRT